MMSIVGVSKLCVHETFKIPEKKQKRLLACPFKFQQTCTRREKGSPLRQRVWGVPSMRSAETRAPTSPRDLVLLIFDDGP